MSRQVSRPGAIAVGLLLIATIALFIVLNAAFGGPDLGIGSPSFRVSAYMGDAQNLVVKSLVLDRGVSVGDVTGVRLVGDRALVTIAVDPGETRIYRNATVEVGHRSLFGEAYVRLDPGTPDAGTLRSGSVLGASAVRPAVELDDALQAVGKSTRAHVSSLLHTGAQVDSAPESSDELNGTLAGLGGTLSALRTFSGDLVTQRAQLTGLVADSTAVVQDLAQRDEAITGLVSGARATAEALTADDGALRSGLTQASLLLASARSTLAAVTPFARRALPVVSTLASAAPPLTSALLRLPAVSTSLRSVIGSLPAFDAAAVPALHALRGVDELAVPLVHALEPVLRDAGPVIRYLGPHGPELVGFLGLTAGVHILTPQGTAEPPTLAQVEKIKPFTQLGVDGAPYGWFRFFLDRTPGTILGNQDGVGINPYAPPNQPNTPFTGSYPRLQPDPAPHLR